MRKNRLLMIVVATVMVLGLVLAACAAPAATTKPAPSPTVQPEPGPAPATTSSPLPRTKITYAATITSSSVFPVNVAFTEVLNTIPNVTVAAESYGSGVACGDVVAKGDVYMMGQSSAQGLYQAYNGVMDFKDKGPVWNTIRVLSISGLLPMNEVVLDTVKSRKDLAGKTVAVSSGTNGVMAKMFYEANGYGPITWIDTLNTEVIIERMKRGDYAGFVGKGGISDAMILRILTESPNTYLLPMTQAEIDTAAKKYPGQFTAGTMPANAFPRQPQPVLTWVGTTIDAVNYKLAEPVVYEMAKTIYKNRNRLAAINELLTKVYGEYPDNLIKYAQTPVHPGVVRFMRDDLKMQVPDFLIPPEMKK